MSGRTEQTGAGFSVGQNLLRSTLMPAARVLIIVNIIILVNDAIVFLAVIFITVFCPSVSLSLHASHRRFISPRHKSSTFTPFFYYLHHFT